MIIDISSFRFFEGETFEQVVMQIYGDLGYDVETTPHKGDQGVDLFLYKEDQKIAVQCKRFSNSVGNKAVQEVFAGMHFYNCNKAMVVTCSKFTRGAEKLARALNVELVGKKELNRMLLSNNNYIGENFYKNTHLTRWLINAGNSLMENGLYKEAIELLDVVLSYGDLFLGDNENDRFNAYNYLALCHGRLGNTEKAIHTIKKGLEYGKNNVLLINLSVSNRMEGRYLEAKKVLEQVEINCLDNSFHEHYFKLKRDVDSLVELTNQVEAGLISERKYIQEKESMLEKYGGK